MDLHCLLLLFISLDPVVMEPPVWTGDTAEQPWVPAGAGSTARQRLPPAGPFSLTLLLCASPQCHSPTPPTAFLGLCRNAVC